jgi:hypothetical protein
VKKTSYGYSTLISIPGGLSETILMDKINILESNLAGIVEVERDKFKDYAIMRVVDRDIDKFMFEPVKCKPNEIYIGKDIKGKDCKLNLRKDCHILIAGMTGTGKTFLLASILANMIYNNPNNIEIYLSQIVKGEIGVFENCGPVRKVDTDIVQVDNTLSKICRIIQERSALFTRYGIKNIEQWNKHFPTKKKKEIFYIAEEFSFLMNYGSVIDKIQYLTKAGRSCGVHLFGILQRTTATELDPLVKSQMTRITFKQKSIIDSQNVISSNDAIKLKDRECIVDGMSETIQVKTPFVDEDFVILNKFVPEIRIPTKEFKQEVINIKKECDKVVITLIPNVIDVESEDIEDVEPNYNSNSKPQKKQREEKGVITLEEFLKRRRG